MVPPDTSFLAARHQIAELAAKERLPACYGYREHADDGGLISYGVSLAAIYGRAASYVDKIMKGSRAADLPVEQPTKFELVINLRTAKALGLTLPPDAYRPGRRGDRMSNSAGREKAGALETTKPVPVIFGALIYTPSNAGSAISATEQEAAARQHGMSLIAVPVDGADDIEAAFASLAREQVEAIEIHPTPIIQIHRAAIAKRAIDLRLPTITVLKALLRDGFLLDVLKQMVPVLVLLSTTAILWWRSAHVARP